MTDSASSGTPFASGLKSKSGVVNRDPETQISCDKNVAELAKVIAINPTIDRSSAMPCAIDRPESTLSLKEMVEVAIANREAGPKKRWEKETGPARQGFFLMVEGGRIDWAGHANDAVDSINDILDVDAAVGVAVELASRHPNETLIVVTGDHETGGMSVGHATTA
jgi:alkaline phosphatase